MVSLLRIVRKSPPDPRRQGLIWMQRYLAGLCIEAEQAIEDCAQSKDTIAKLPRLMAQQQVINELQSDVRRELGDDLPPLLAVAQRAQREGMMRFHKRSHP